MNADKGNGKAGRRELSPHEDTLYSGVIGAQQSPDMGMGMGIVGVEERRNIANAHDETKLPLWAQAVIADLRRDLATVQQEFHNQSQAHRLLQDRTWFPVYGPKGPDGQYLGPPEGVYHLWMLHPDHPHTVCSLSGRDVLLVGRDLTKWDRQKLGVQRAGEIRQGE